MSAWSRFIKKLYFGIRAKVLLLFSAVIIFSIFFMSYFAVTTYGRKLELNSTTHSNQVVGNLVRNLENYISEIESISGTIIYNNYINNYLIGKEIKPENTKGGLMELYRASSQNFQTSVEILSNTIYTRQDICSIMIFTGDKLSMYKSSYFNIDNNFDFPREKWYLSAMKAKGAPVVTGPHLQKYIKQSPETVFSMSRTMQSYDSLGYQGVLLIDTNLKRITTYCNSARLNNDGFIVITDFDGNIVYQPPVVHWSVSRGNISTERLLKNILPSFSNAPEGTFKADIDNEQYQIVYKHMDKADWYVTAVTPYKSIVADANSIKNLIIVVGVFCLIFILIISYFISTRITKPIITLKQYMDQADHGNLNIRAPIKSNDEVGMLASSFNNMLERIESLMRQVVQEQEAKRKSELKALQHQINPHFLYNTLDSIIWMAESKEESIVPMTEALSRFFRISLSRGQELITLGDELDHVRNYLFIQTMRYRNKFDFEIISDESLLQFKTLKLILQPLVENSIYHGIKNKMGKGHVQINTYTQSTNLIIEISDNGIGMDPKTISSILNSSSSNESTKSSGIGVRNVDERIKLFFGKEYGLNFKSTASHGTTAYVCLPIIKD